MRAHEVIAMPKVRPLGKFHRILYGSPPSALESEDDAAARWAAATEPCVECGRWLEPGDGYTCEYEEKSGRWRMYCAECL